MSIWANVTPTVTELRAVEDLVIIGSGPAGYTAALYGARAKRSPLVIEGLSPGGLLQETDVVENFPGYPDGVTGPALMADLRQQAARFGARFLAERVSKVALADAPGAAHRLWTGGRELVARALIVATGASPRRLGVPGEQELGGGRGLAYCAVCEAPLYAGRATLVIGGGDSAMEEALALARHARSVVLVHRRAEFAASPIMRERAQADPRIEIRVPYRVDRFVAGEGGRLAGATLRHAVTGATHELAVDGAFVAVGHQPSSELVRGRVATDERGHIQCLPGSRATSVPGVFACGDVVDARYRQAVTAAASGCEAALDAQRYLDHHPVAA